ncbi:MAG: ATP-grasp domain-containing protein [Deltaproteobacteria bacterium]|nr:ATP-grasp domain-containing protein [Deltaproteobacteria bacterium]
MNVLITDGENRSALAATRSLGRKGHDIIVTGLDPDNISACSKFCKRNYQTPNPLKDGMNYSEKIAEIVTSEKIDIILPMTEQSIYQLNRVRDHLPKNVILACPCQEKMDAVSNKFRLFQLAQDLGVPIPETTFVSGIEDFLEKEPGIANFPAVVKPAFSKIADGDGLISAGVMYAADRNELRLLYETKTILRYPSLIQELIVGEGTGLFTLFDHDHHLVLFSHRRLLEKPPSGGVSVMSESIPLDPEMVKSAEKLLSEVGWKGVAMVEFKRDIRDGKAKLMEINGRFWGSLQLAVSSGVDFPALYLDYYFNNKPFCILDNYRIGHRLKWLLGIMDHLIIRIKHFDRLQRLLPEFYTCRQVIMELFMAKNANTTLDVYDSEDRKPFISEIKFYIKNLI